LSTIADRLHHKNIAEARSALIGPKLPLNRQPFATVQHRKSGRLKFPAKDAIQTRNQKESDLWAS
jgi:hypothetical protein